MSLVLLFAGQGVQHPDMLGWLDGHPRAAPTLARMAARLGADWRLRLGDADWATGNRVAQCLLTGIAVAAWEALAPRLPAPAAVAGYSVGELAACCVAGVFDAEEALALADERAAAMDACAAAQAAGGLLAVSGLPVARLAALGATLGFDVAIRQAPDRAVIGGALPALAAAAPALAALGANLTELKVRVASHTPAMAPAARRFAVVLAGRPWPTARVPVVTNLDGAAERRPDALRHALAEQIGHPVQWEQAMTTLAERRPRCALEIGPGQSLARLWAAAHPDVPVRSVDEFRSDEAVADWVRRATA